MDGATVVWFKRDLRVRDHRPLSEAAKEGQIVPLYIVEPSLWTAPDADGLHWKFVRESLVELRNELLSLGTPLVVRTGEAVEVLDDLRSSCRFVRLVSHEETGTDLTYRRDRAVAQWCRDHRIAWKEYPQHGVFRGLQDRDGWSKRWEKRMAEPVTERPRQLVGPQLEPGTIPTGQELGVVNPERKGAQTGGEAEGRATLESFLAGRGGPYSKAMSSPNTAPTACSRISPYLAWGCLSMREVVQTSRRTFRQMKENDYRCPDGTRFAAGSMRSFDARLHWHCHFIQKLESEPELEFLAMNRALDDLRTDGHEAARLEAFETGQTGYPFVDACLRYLQETGWINFRMRAMLVSFAAYNLWLDWRAIHPFLARQWIDYEPGIHFSQLQMQSGVTGINTLRIYNPVKQGHDHDPAGDFIGEWVPELAGLTTADRNEPWQAGGLALQAAGVRLGHDYPGPLVDHKKAVKEAREKLGRARAQPFFRKEKERVYEKHGSRKQTTRSRR